MNNKIKNINYTYLFILSTVSFIWFILKEHTAYDWPAIDMMPFFERYFDSSFLVNDFFTNAISNEPNPRWSFGYFIIGLSKIFNAGWYTISYSLKVILVICTPVLYYLVLYFSIRKYIDNEKLKNIQIVLLMAILIVIYPRFSGLFSIAWWKPYFIQVVPQNISIFLGLLAIVFKEIKYNSQYYTYLSMFLFAAATLIHPAIGLFVIIFYFLINFKTCKQNYKYLLLLFLVGFLLPVIFIKLFFSSSVSIDTLNFVNIYAIENHSSHYHVENFGTHTPFSWIYSFILMFILLLIPLIYFYIKSLRNNLILTILFLLSFIVPIILQYIFIDLLPSKTMASIGPVRFTQFTYWMIVISWSIMLSNLWFLKKINYNFNLNKLYLVIGGGTSL